MAKLPWYIKVIDKTYEDNQMIITVRPHRIWLAWIVIKKLWFVKFKIKEDGKEN